MIYTARTAYEVPQLDLLSFLFDSPVSLATENTVVHAEAANPSNGITKALARTLTRRIADTLRYSYGIGQHGPGKDIVVAGGVASLASPSFKAEELARQIKQGSAKLCIACPISQSILSEAAHLSGLSPNLCLVLDSSSPWRLYMASDPAARNMVGKSELEWERITDKDELENSLICLLYSSGTTGPPKGVKMSHTNMVSEAFIVGANLREHWRKEGKWDYRTLAHLPSAHVAGGYFVIPFYHGGTTYWMPKFDFVDFLAFNRALEITSFFSVPPIYLLISKSPLVKDHFRALRTAVSGAAPLGKELQALASKKLGVFLTQTWGLSETTGSTTGSETNVEDLSGSVGPVLPNVEVRIVDDSGNDCSPNTPGEVLVRGPIVTKGYYNDPKTNSETFRDGYLCTGDIGFFQDGRLHIVDRKKELIKYKGNQVAPAELEAVLLSHPKILDAGVIGIYDAEQCTEVPRAYVVADKALISAREIEDFVASHLASHKQLRGGVEFVEAIPKSASGKILRKDLRALAGNKLKAKL
ncbi:hypothetical protein B0H10DRAFT_2161841 [Mycena sp. CBHHK59/15]|nr:hypothetical protein B0H10DRAFT_2161841 [Mycena sp. CBHHK59/15]